MTPRPMRLRDVSLAATAALLTSALLTTKASAQRWSVDDIPTVGIQIRVPDTVQVQALDPKESPLQIQHLKHRYASISRSDGLPDDGNIRVLVFPKKLTKEQKKDRNVSRNFDDFVRNHKVYIGERTFHTEGEKTRGRRKTPDHVVWEYSESAVLGERTEPMTHYHIAGVYNFDDRQVAVVYDFWARDNKPDRKEIANGKQVVSSVVPTQIVDATSKLSKDPRARHADTPAKMKVVEAAVGRIQALEGWDFITTEDVLVLYTHDDKPGKKKKQQKEAVELAETFAKLRAKFEEDWPPAEDQTLSYPVLRVCHERDLFSPFANPGAQIGRFIPETGEVAIFNDAAGSVANPDCVRQTMIACAWEQYANAYWPDTPFQRWWLYGTADYYAQFEPRGRKLRFKAIENGYIHFETDSKGRFRYESPKTLLNGDIRDDSFAPLRDFVTWNDGKFDGARPANHRAQAYAFVDFLVRGPEELGKRFDDSWATIWRDYPAELARSRSTSKTVSKVFADVDYGAMQDAWKAWVKKNM